MAGRKRSGDLAEWEVEGGLTILLALCASRFGASNVKFIEEELVSRRDWSGE